MKTETKPATAHGASHRPGAGERRDGRLANIARQIQRRAEPLLSSLVAIVLLRAFLGGTMLYASLDKILLDPRFLQESGVGSIGDTLRQFVVAGGPLAWLVEAVAVDRPVVIGMLMSGTQGLVGVLLLSGVAIRIAALFGAAVSLSLALTSSWGVAPYYYGNDLPYLVGFLALALIGGGSLLKFAQTDSPRHDPSRRAALAVGGSALLGIGVLALLDRTRLAALITGEGERSPAPSTAASGSPSASPAESATPSPSNTPAGSPTARPSTAPPSTAPTASPTVAGTPIAGGSALASGAALNFDAGGTGAVLVRDGATFRAFERACTHQGQPVNWDGSQFVCPLHGARFSATGVVLLGPANRPLVPIEILIAPDGTVSYRR